MKTDNLILFMKFYICLALLLGVAIASQGNNVKNL